MFYLYIKGGDHMIKTGTPFLVFYDECEEALNYYVEVFGAEIIEKTTFEDVDCMDDISRKNCIAHATFKLGESLFYASDFLDKEERNSSTKPQITIWLEIDSAENIQPLVEKLLSTGSTSLFPLAESFWGSQFAEIQDKFGIIWELNAQM